MLCYINLFYWETRGEKNKKKKDKKKRKRGKQLGEKKNAENRGSFFPSSLRCCEIRKAGSRRERREKKRQKKKRRNKEEAGTDFRYLLYFSANKICRTGEKKVQESVEREWRRRKGKKRQETDANTKQKEKVWNRRTQTEQPSCFQRCCSFFVSRSVSLHFLHVFFFFMFALFKWIIIHLNSYGVSL